jgi:hypothetical protein
MAATISCPVVVNVQADGTAKLEVIKLEDYVITGSEKTFSVNALLGNAVFDGFGVEEGTPDASADHTVTLADPDAFGNALGSLAAASADGGQSLPAWLLAFAKSEIEGALNANDVAQSAEAEEIHALQHDGFEAAAQDGSRTMAATLAVDGDKLNLLYAQFPAARFEGNDTAMTKLPYQVGDKFVVQFIINQEVNVSATTLDITGAEGSTAAGAQISLGQTVYSIGAKTISVEITAVASL